MAKIQTIKRRIKSVSNTRQITKAMELVSASKMRRAQESMLRTRPYVTNAKEVLGRLIALSPVENFPLFAKREIKKRLIIVVTSDRGLAGAYNSGILRLLTKTLNEQRGTTQALIVIGQKGANFASKLNSIELTGVYVNWPTSPTSTDIRPIAHTAISQFMNGDIDAVDMLYTKLHTLIKQEAVLERVLPVEPEKSDAVSTEEALFEPSPREILDVVVPRLIESQIFQAVLEANASEQAMRMVAMKNASDNAEGLIDDLTLTFNGARQAAITQELA